MGIKQHDLIHEFPEYKERIHELKMNDSHFHNLFNQYDDLTTKVEALENQDVPVTDEHIEGLKKERLAIKDKIYQMLTK